MNPGSSLEPDDATPPNWETTNERCESVRKAVWARVWGVVLCVSLFDWGCGRTYTTLSRALSATMIALKSKVLRRSHIDLDNSLVSSAVKNGNV